MPTDSAEDKLMIDCKVDLVLGILHVLFLAFITIAVGGYFWAIGQRAVLGTFFLSGVVGIGHLLVTLLQVNRIDRGRAGKMKNLPDSTIGYWRLRMVAIGLVAAYLQGQVVPIGIEKHAPPALLTAAAINVGVIVSGTWLGFSRLKSPKTN